MDPIRHTAGRLSVSNSELSSPRSSYNNKMGEEISSPRRRDEEKNTLTISAIKRPNTPSMNSNSITMEHIGKAFSESRSSSVPRSFNSEPSFMRETISNAQKFSSSGRANSPSTPRMKFGIVDYSKSRAHNSPVVQLKPPIPKANTDRIDIEVPAKTIQDLSIVIGLGTLSVPNYKITSFEGLGVRDDIKILFIQNNYLTSFKFMNSQPNLESINIANNCICSCYGLKVQPKLQSINMEGNPISNHPKFRFMVLMCVGFSLRTINKDRLVQFSVVFREREFVKQFIQRNPLVVDAVRAGWLLDLRERTTEEYQSIIDEYRQYDMDDRNFLRSSEAYNSLLQYKEEDRAKRNLSAPTDQSVENPSATKLTDSSNSNHNHLEQEIRALKLEVAKKTEELRLEKAKQKDFSEEHLSAEELFYFSSFEVNNVNVALSKNTENITESSAIILQFNTAGVAILSEEFRSVLKYVAYTQVSRTSLLQENENKLYRLHMQITGGEIIDVLCNEKTKALTVYKALHLFISHANKLRKQMKAKQKTDTVPN